MVIRIKRFISFRISRNALSYIYWCFLKAGTILQCFLLVATRDKTVVH